MSAKTRVLADQTFVFFVFSFNFRCWTGIRFASGSFRPISLTTSPLSCAKRIHFTCSLMPQAYNFPARYRWNKSGSLFHTHHESVTFIVFFPFLKNNILNFDRRRDLCVWRIYFDKPSLIVKVSCSLFKTRVYQRCIPRFGIQIKITYIHTYYNTMKNSRVCLCTRYTTI